MNEAAEGLRDSFVFGDPDTNQENKDAAVASGIQLQVDTPSTSFNIVQPSAMTEASRKMFTSKAKAQEKMSYGQKRHSKTISQLSENTI